MLAVYQLYHAFQVGKQEHKLTKALCAAVEDGQVGEVKTLISLGAHISGGFTGKLPIICAARSSCAELTQVLLAAKASVGSTNAKGETPLMIASELGHLETVKVLLAAGADVNAIDKEGHNAVWKASQGGFSTIARLLLASRNRTTSTVTQVPACDAEARGNKQLWNAATCGDTQAVIAALNVGADVETPIYEGMTPLMVASRNGHAEVVELLLAGGADVNCVSPQQGWTALMNACGWGHVDVVKVLVAAGADLAAIDDQGCTALMHAALHKDSSAAMILLGQEASTAEAGGGMARNLPATAQDLFMRLREVVIGQDVALKNIARTLDQLAAGLLPNTKPLVLIFAGPSRCGKTETAEQISNFVSNQPRFTLHMGQFSLSQNVAKLNGSDPGYAGSPDGVLAFLGQCHKPVVILDEIEKACDAVLMWFLNVFDKGQFTTGAGKVIDCKSAVFIMTSNIGTDLLREKAAILRTLSLTSQQLFGDQELRPLFIEQGWRPEFWARIDMAVPFLPLSEQDRIVGAKHFLQKRMTTLNFVRDHNLCISWSDAVARQVASSHGGLSDSLGFNAFSKSRAYEAALEEMRRMADTKSSAVPGFWYVDYQNVVIVRDLLGHPSEATRADATSFLQTLAPLASQQSLGPANPVAALSKQLPTDAGTTSSLASNGALASQQPLSLANPSVGTSEDMPKDTGISGSRLAGNGAVLFSASVLFVLVHFAAYLLKPVVTLLL